MIVCLAYSTIFDFTSEENERFINIGNSTAKGFHKYKSGKGFHSFITVADSSTINHYNIGEHFTKHMWQYSFNLPGFASWKTSSVLSDFYFEETKNTHFFNLYVFQSFISTFYSILTLFTCGVMGTMEK